VRDLAARITAQFAANLEATLGGKTPAPVQDINPLSLLIGVLRNRIRSWFGRSA
jgi:carbon-monoxide dehydrogenase small subunit